MTVEREYYFANNEAYNLHLTQATIQKRIDNGAEVTTHTLACIHLTFSDLRFNKNNPPVYMPDLYDSTLVPIDIWFAKYGVTESLWHELEEIDNHMDIMEDLTVGTWTCDDDSNFTLEGEECISDDDEQILIRCVSALSEINAETQNLVPGRVLMLDDIESLHESDLEYSDYD